jgi:hypothetical protein
MENELRAIIMTISFTPILIRVGNEWVVQKYAIRLKIGAKIFGLRLTMWATKHMANVVFADE